MKAYYVHWYIITEFGFENGKDKFYSKKEAEEYADELFENDYSVKVVEAKEK